MNIWLYCTAGAMAGLATCLLVAAAVSRRRPRGGPVFRRGAQVAPARFVDSPLGSQAWLMPGGQPVVVPDAATPPPPLPVVAVAVADLERTRPIRVPAGLDMELTFAGESPLADDRLWQGLEPPAAEADPPDPAEQADADPPLTDAPAGPLDTDDPPADTAEPGSARLFNEVVHEFAEGGRLDPDQTLDRTTALIVARYRRPNVDRVVGED